MVEFAIGTEIFFIIEYSLQNAKLVYRMFKNIDIFNDLLRVSVKDYYFVI